MMFFICGQAIATSYPKIREKEGVEGKCAGERKYAGGDCFGEEMLEHPFTESFHYRDCVAIDDIVVVKALSLSDYEAFFRTMKLTQQFGRSLLRQTKLLKKIPYLAALDDSDIHTLVDVMELKHYNAGDQIIRQGDVGDMLCVIVRGVADVYRRSPNPESALNPNVHNLIDTPDAASRHEFSIPGLALPCLVLSCCVCYVVFFCIVGSIYLATLREGVFFGEQAIFEPDCTRNATIVAVTSMSCMLLHRQHVMDDWGDQDSKSQTGAINQNGIFSPLSILRDPFKNHTFSLLILYIK